MRKTNRVFDDEAFKIMDNQIKTWMRDEVIEEVTKYKKDINKVHIINPVSIVPKKDLDENGKRKYRITLDPSFWQNKYTKAEFVSMSGTKEIMESLEKDDYAVKFDLKDGFLHLKINEEDRKYLCFEFNGRIYRFKKFIWGPSSTPAEFYKLMNLIKERLNKLNIRTAHHSDDWIILGKSFGEAMKNAETFVRLMNEANINLNIKKSNIYPTKLFDFVGMRFNTERMTVEMKDFDRERILELIEDILELKEGSKISKKDLYAILKTIQMKTLNHKEIHLAIKCLYQLGVGYSYYWKEIPITNELHNYFKIIRKEIREMTEIFFIDDWRKFLSINWKEYSKKAKEGARERIYDSIDQQG